MAKTKLLIAGIVKESVVDGPGIRYVIFVQGCKHHCFNCHNPATWSFDGGTLLDEATIIKEINENPLLSGVTISGGDPFFQKEALLRVIKLIKEATKKEIIVYTGFTVEALLADDDPLVAELFRYIDILIDGPYRHELRDLSLKFIGSSNQRIINLKTELGKYQKK
ncbi:MAG: anaerobic ribonucleoside-triphosphate reductase activating protein [Erysipelotrichaceae bacterium]|nr:anaerobic ribonucleoside-triphosphate reductase activating protein [Erysipelotrichaceae bacterium]